MPNLGETLVGRTRELSSLDRALTEVERNDPSALALVGEPGMGKTRLLAELSARAERRGNLVLSGSASELERELPFWVFIDALDEYLEGLDPRRLAALDEADRAQLGHVFPSFDAHAAGVGAGLQDERFRTHRAVRRLFEVLAVPKPLVLVLDDVHWADAGTIELLGSLLRRPPAAAVLIAIAVRPRQLPPLLSGTAAMGSTRSPGASSRSPAWWSTARPMRRSRPSCSWPQDGRVAHPAPLPEALGVLPRRGGARRRAGRPRERAERRGTQMSGASTTAFSHPRGATVEPLRLGGIVVLSLGALDFGLEQSLIIPALPALAEHYGASLGAIAWMVTGFVLASIVAIPLVGRLGDMFGKRRMLLVSLAAFAIGSLVCALAESSGLAIAGRVIQGLGSAVAPLTYGLARDTVAPERLPHAIGAVVGGASAGAAIGFLLSGLLVDVFSAAAVFWFLLGFAILIAIAVRVLVRESPVRADVRLDVGGAALLGLGLLALLLAISRGSTWGWTSGRTLATFVAALALLATFALVEDRVRQPLVNLGLVVTRPFASANLCAFAFGYSFFIAVFVIPQIAAAPASTGYGLGLSTTGIGLVLLPTGVASLVGGLAGGRAVERVGPRTLVASGSALGIAGYTSLALAHASPAALAIGSAALGLAWGLILTGIASVVVRSAAPDSTSVAVAVNAVTRNTAVAIGAQVAFAIIAGADVAGTFPAESGYTWVFGMGGVGAALLMVTSTLMPDRSLPPAAERRERDPSSAGRTDELLRPT